MSINSKALLLSVTAGIAAVGAHPKLAWTMNTVPAQEEKNKVRTTTPQKRTTANVQQSGTPTESKMCYGSLSLPDDDFDASKHTLDDHDWAREHSDSVRKYNADYEKLFKASRQLACLSPHWERGVIYAPDGTRAHIPWSWVR